MLFKCNEENKTFVIYVTQYRVSFRNRKSEHLENKSCSETVLRKIVQVKKFPDNTAEKVKLKIKTICIRNSANKFRENWCKHRRYLCPVFVLIDRTTFFLA
jgi:hypothetical protein